MSGQASDHAFRFKLASSLRHAGIGPVSSLSASQVRSTYRHRSPASTSPQGQVLGFRITTSGPRGPPRDRQIRLISLARFKPRNRRSRIPLPRHGALRPLPSTPQMPDAQVNLIPARPLSPTAGTRCANLLLLPFDAVPVHLEVRTGQDSYPCRCCCAGYVGTDLMTEPGTYVQASQATCLSWTVVRNREFRPKGRRSREQRQRHGGMKP